MEVLLPTVPEGLVAEVAGRARKSKQARGEAPEGPVGEGR